MAKIIINIDTIVHTYAGQEIAASGSYTIQAVEAIKWANDDALMADLASAKAKVNDGTSDIIGLSNQINFLKDIQSNEVVVSSAPAFGSKTIVVAGVTKKLYARNIGFQSALTAGVNLVTHTLTLPWVKMLGVEVINSEALDFVDLKVLDSAAGSYSGVPNLVLNQFAFATNIPKDYYIRMSNFDVDLYVGMQIQITYTSVSAKTVGFNLLTNEVKT